MRRLRAPDGCPWDREQTHDSLTPYLLEEAAEATDALLSGDRQDLVDELGDVLLQIAFHAVLGEESGEFAYDDIEEAIVSKLIRRHPHVFGDVSVRDSDEVRTNWLAIKEQERAEAGNRPKPPVPASLPVLMQIAELHRKGLIGKTGGDSAAARLVDLVIEAAADGRSIELEVRDELRARLS